MSEVAVSPDTDANHAPDRRIDRTAERTPTRPAEQLTTPLLLARLVFLSIATDQAEIAATDPMVQPEERETATAYASLARARWRKTKKVLGRRLRDTDLSM